MLAERESDWTEDCEASPVAAVYWSAWRKLSNDRPLGAMGGAGKIPWSSIERYADKRGLDADVLSRMLWAMDEVYLKWLNEQQKSNKGPPTDAG